MRVMEQLAIWGVCPVLVLLWLWVPVPERPVCTLALDPVPVGTGERLTYHAWPERTAWRDPREDGGQMLFDLSEALDPGSSAQLGLPGSRDTSVILRRQPPADASQGLLEGLDALSGNRDWLQDGGLTVREEPRWGWLADDVHRLDEARELLQPSVGDELGSRIDARMDPFRSNRSTSLFDDD